MAWFCGFVVTALIIGGIAASWWLQVEQQRQQQRLIQRQQELLQLHDMIESKKRELGEVVQRCFMIEPCARCHEFSMQLIEISPNARSVHYRCIHCDKKMRAPAGTPDAGRGIVIRDELYTLTQKYDEMTSQYWRDKIEYEKHFPQVHR